MTPNVSVQPSVLQVVILRDGLLVGTEVFIPGTYAVGSGRGSDLRLDDPAVAEHHATLYFLNGKAAVQDAGGSPRGVYVNGHKIKACEVRPVDEIAFGPFVLKARVLQQRAMKGAPPPEVAAMLAPTPASGAVRAMPAPVPVRQAAPPPARPAQSAAPAVPAVPQVPGTAPSARRMAEQQQRPAVPAAPAVTPARQKLRPNDPAVQAVEEFFGGSGAAGDSPTAPTPIATPAADSGPFVASKALSLDGRVVSNPGARNGASHHDAPTIGVQLPIPDDVEPPPAWEDPVATGQPSVIPSSSVVNFQWPEAPPELEESQPAYVLEQPVQPQPPAPVRAAPPVPKSAPPVAAKAKPAKPAKLKIPKGAPRLYFELHWGSSRTQAYSFVPTEKKPVIAGARDSADVALYGFGLDADFKLGELVDVGVYKVHVPPSAGTPVKIEKGAVTNAVAGGFQPVSAAQVETDANGRFITLKNGQALRFVGAGNHSLSAFVAPPPEKVRPRYLKQIPLLWLICLLGLSYGGGTFLYYAPAAAAEVEFEPKELPAMAVKLIAPEPKKKERVQKKLAEMKAEREKHADKKPTPKVDKSQPQAISQNKALNAIKKLTALSATSNILSAMDKQGGNNKKAAAGYQLTSLLGKGVASPGLTPGLGAGGLGKGRGTMGGGELLRGNSGIGALGAGGFGKGSVGGTVGRASGRAIQSSGSIDRDAVAKVVNEHLGEVSSCYERALLKEPGLAGKVVLEWSIGSNGRVASVKSKSSTLRSSAVEGCIMNALKKWVFPQPRGGSVIITYPFLFNSVGF